MSIVTARAVSFENAQARPSVGVNRVTAALLLSQFVFQFAALFILGSAINWPASLDEPAAVTLPLILEQRNAVALGYTSYFLSALLLAPIAVLIAHLTAKGRGRALMLVAASIGVLASFAKLLGISRWLLLMPLLAQSYTAPGASEAVLAATTVTFDAFNAYAGGVGELLGVAFLSGLWTLGVSVTLLQDNRIAPRWMGVFGVIAAALLLVAVASAYGVDVGPILLVQGFAWQFWMLALAFFLFRQSRNPTHA
jgi:hypothetical protein